jgi:hypothetical protein
MLLLKCLSVKIFYELKIKFGKNDDDYILSTAVMPINDKPFFKTCLTALAK